MTFKEATLPAEVFILFTNDDDDTIYEGRITDLIIDEENDECTLLVDELFDHPVRLGGLHLADLDRDSFHGANVHLFLTSPSATAWLEAYKADNSTS